MITLKNCTIYDIKTPYMAEKGWDGMDNLAYGIILDFHKHMVRSTECQNPMCCILGFYDDLMIYDVKRFADLTPLGIERFRNSHHGCEQTDSYIVKLVGNVAGQDLMHCTLNAPLLGVILLRLNPAFVVQHKYDKIINEFNALLSREKATDSQSPFFSWKIFYSIGYYDLVIITKSAEWSIVDQFIQTLRALRFTNKKEEQPVVGNSHVIYGFYTECSKFAPSKQTFAIRFTLHAGETVAYFKQELKKEPLLQKILPSTHIESTHGRTDCRLVCTAGLDAMLPLYTDPNSPFNTCSVFYKLHIRKMRTSLHFPPPAPVSEAKSAAVPESLWDSTVDKMLADFRLFIRDYSLHERSLHSLYITLKHAYTLINIPFSDFSTRNIKLVVESFVQNLTGWITYLRKRFKSEDEYNRNQILGMESMIEEFRNRVGQHIVDLMRSDRFFMESITLIHSSIGSATKMLIAYNNMINYCARKYEDACQNNIEPFNVNYAFLITSGGCDITTSYNLTSPLSPALKTNKGQLENRVIVLKLSERSIFDIPGTMFRILHEGFHFFGDRMRKSRANYLVKAVCKFLAQQISDQILYTSTIDKTEEIKDPEKRMQWEDFLQEKLKNAQSENADELYKALCSTMESVMIADADSIFDYYKSPLISNMKSQYTELFVPLPEYTDLTGLLYRTQLQALMRLHSEIEDEARKRDIVTTFGMSAATLRKQNDDLAAGKYTSKTIMTNLIQLQMTLCGLNASLNSEILSIDEIIDMFYDAFSETFSDCMACRMLGCTEADYLLAFLYERWNIKIALPNENSSHILRVGATLKKCFSIENKLNAESENHIRERVNYYISEHIWRLVSDGKPIILNESEIINNINTALEQYSRLPTRCFLEEYIDECFKSRLNINEHGILKSSFFESKNREVNTSVLAFYENWLKESGGDE